ncbi:DEAD/DEAH box helicase [Nitrosomonas sp. Nm132]|uniref:DEAD/DEAH box helicase n=1 Tax=Nitrosomonas sp. Nm132 TaxID=1881053 RepID=UPI000881157D|nr:DEAD/DEAH box helicase [Nitrosomonas sp. Nm132]SDG83334.1 Superfamily II DNA or RNA helicase, SNF2 family [Nitrosomonas sp. Nm132]
MTAHRGYGQTWWGAQWLNSLSQIDYDNRLPRGRSYANKGAVTKIEIQHGKIHAKVKGSRPRPYDVAIKVPAMPQQQAKALLDALALDPVIISKMLNRELDPAVLERAKALKVDIFPARWTDLSMSCSCPDWAVPCKHLAAVIYLISREIDGNPFLVFSLKGVDLTKELAARHISIEREAKATLPTVTALLDQPSQQQAALVQDSAGLEDYSTLDYSILPDLAASLMSVLPANPAFFRQGDFRIIYEKVMKRVIKQARLALKTVAAMADIKSVAITPADKPRVVLDHTYQPALAGLTVQARWIDWVFTLQQLVEADLPDLQPEVAAMYHARMVSLHLLAQGAVLPQVFAVGESEAGLRWLPAMLDEAVRTLVNRLASLLPPGLLAYRSGKKAVNPTGEAQVLALCSLFLGELIRYWGDARNQKPYGNKLLDLFFGRGHARFDGPGEGEVGSGVQLWLSRFHVGQQTYVPVLQLEDNGAEFSLSLGVVARDNPLQEPVPFARLLTDKAWQTNRYGVLQTVSLLAEFFPAFNHYISAGATAPVALSPETFPAFLFDTLPIIRLLGIRALLPKALDHLLRPRLSMKLSSKNTGSTGFLNANDIFGFDWTVAIGNTQLTRAEFEELVKTAHGVVRFKGEYVYLEPADIERLRRQLEKPPRITPAELLRTALSEEYLGTPISLDAKARDIIRELTEISNVPLPSELNAILRPYQERGYAWLYRNIRAGFGSVMADDMGLGKTLQVIVTLLKLKEEGSLHEAKALVIVPTSLLTNWTKEIARFAPTLTVHLFHGAERMLAKERADVLLTTYGRVRTDLAKLKKLSWRIVIVDEAQNIKNSVAAQTKAVKSIPASSFVALTGTPVENRLAEYWSIMDFANRGFLGNLTHFTKEFAVPIQNDHDQQVAQRFKRVTSPFLLRRLKSDKSIISDLPDKIEQNQYCELTNKQAALYESVVREALQVINGESDTFKREGLILQMIMALKQICNHPAQYLKKGDSDASLSGKAELFLDLLDPIFAAHEKVLVFTQFREAGDLLAAWIKTRYGREPQFLHGGVARKTRDIMVERFQHDRTERVFLLSLKAGGTGLNLTAATNVIHFDLWWNPAVEAQATDRAYRIGQQHNVQVHRLITRATFEERINDMIQSKRELADLTVGIGEKWMGNLSNAELKDVFSLG